MTSSHERSRRRPRADPALYRRIQWRRRQAEGRLPPRRPDDGPRRQDGHLHPDHRLLRHGRRAAGPRGPGLQGDMSGRSTSPATRASPCWWRPTTWAATLSTTSRSPGSTAAGRSPTRPTRTPAASRPTTPRARTNERGEGPNTAPGQLNLPRQIWRSGGHLGVRTVSVAFLGAQALGSAGSPRPGRPMGLTAGSTKSAFRAGRP